MPFLEAGRTPALAWHLTACLDGGSLLVVKAVAGVLVGVLLRASRRHRWMATPAVLSLNFSTRDGSTG